MPTSNEIRSQRLNELIAKAKADAMLLAAADKTEPTAQIATPIIAPYVEKERIIHEANERLRIAQDALLEKAREETAILIAENEKNAVKYVWNEEQTEAINRTRNGESINLIGKAGTGKTTNAKEIVRILQQEGVIAPLRSSTKYLSEGLPGVAIISFTNRAVKNIAKGMPGDIKAHCLTVHKLLEFKPEFFEVLDAKGEPKKTMKFLPSRNRINPLPSSLKLIIVEESSMISTDLWKQLMDAIPHKCQFVFLGDLQQLPPVYGQAILGFKLLELPVVELTKIYRQAEGSPIISFAWDIAYGKEIPVKDFPIITESSKDKNGVPRITLRPWKKRLTAENALEIMSKLFNQFVDNGLYNPNEDMIMIPFNKSFGTIEFNKNLAHHLGRKRGATVYEVIAGYVKHYFAVGDKILCDRQEAIIEDIVINDRYVGVIPMPPSPLLNRWGMYDQPENKDKEHETSEKDLEEVEKFLMLTMMRQEGENEEAKQQASHVLMCRLLDSDEIREVRTTGEYSATVFAYALTVHKCQGSEWRKCFLLLHHSHSMIISRELLYTGVTRAREELYIICEPDSLVKGVKAQRIKGNTIAEKAEFFKGKLEREIA